MFSCTNDLYLFWWIIKKWYVINDSYWLMREIKWPCVAASLIIQITGKYETSPFGYMFSWISPLHSWRYKLQEPFWQSCWLVRKNILNAVGMNDSGCNFIMNVGLNLKFKDSNNVLFLFCFVLFGFFVMFCLFVWGFFLEGCTLQANLWKNNNVARV